MPSPANIPNPMPIAPPTAHSATASIRNCMRISARFAPTAFRSPISRVRSVTRRDPSYPMRRRGRAAITPRAIF